MQIIAGSCRGMKLATAKSDLTRPTGARAREAIMQILSSQLEGASFVDFFAGSGAMGLEALSRGCGRCYLVEQASEAAAAIDKNLAELARRLQVQNIRGQEWYVLKQSAQRSLPFLFKQFKSHPEPVIIYADPPYGPAALVWLREFLQELASHKLRNEFTLVIESSSHDAAAITEHLRTLQSSWERHKERRYGKAQVHFYTSLPQP